MIRGRMISREAVFLIAELYIAVPAYSICREGGTTAILGIRVGPPMVYYNLV